jgi:hypothetical protein
MHATEVFPAIGFDDDARTKCGRRLTVPREELLPVAPECDLDEMRHANRSYSVN